MTIRDVAVKAGVAPSTVSLALKADPRVSAETQALVRRVAAALGYRPRRRGRPRRRSNEPAATRRSNRIALLVPGMPRPVLQSPVYMEVLHGVEAATGEADRTFVLRHLPPDTPVPANLFSQKVDGVVLFGDVRDPDAREQLANLTCVRVMGIPEPGAPWDHVTYDNRAVGAIAADFLLRRGHRHCAVIVEEQPATSGSIGLDRGQAFADAISAAGGTWRLGWEKPIYELTATEQRINRQAMSRVLDRLLAADPRPTGIFASADQLTNALYPLLLERGIRPGTDMDVVSCNNEPLWLQNLHPRPATVDIHAHEIGRRAVQRVLQRIESPDDSRTNIILAPELVFNGDDSAQRERTTR